MNCFKFHPVGQGLFYTGALANKTYNFVYDCGTESKQHYLISSIDSYIKEIQRDASNKPHIDFVVVSHLHKDHFSGLLELARKTNIRRVYLPYLGNDKNFISLILAYIIWGNESSINDNYLYSLFDFMRGLYGIRGNYDFSQIEAVFLEENAEEYSDHEFAYSKHEEYAHIESQEYWKFTFINRRICSSKLRLLNSKMNKILDDYGVENIVELIATRNGLRKVAEIYNEVFSYEIAKDSNFLNMTSIMLIHHPLYNSPKSFYADSNEIMNLSNRRIESHYFSHWNYCNYTCFDFNRIRNPSTILSGDVMIDNVMAKIILSQLKLINDNKKSLCGVLQVPHHGSKANWLAWKATAIDSQIYVIPFGFGNRHRHPNTYTIDDLVLSQQHIQLVNQIQNFEYYID